MSDLKGLIKQRANIRARLTLLEKYVAPLEECKEVTPIQINELSLRLNKMRDLSITFEEIQSGIETLDEDTTKQMEERESTENLLYKLIARTQSLLEYFEKTNNVETSSNGSRKGFPNVKLPPIKIQNYNGDSSKWLSYRDTYLSLIHNNEDIDDINKFHYLESSLEGAARSVIASVTVSANNYAIAWNLLCERYDNKRLLINEHIKSLFSIEPLYRETDSGIRNLIDTLSKNLNALNSLGEPTDRWDSIIIYMATTKLDSVTARNWEECRSSKDSPTLEEFYSFLRQRATVLETVNASRSLKNEKRSNFQKNKSFIASSVESSPGKYCEICKQNHRLYECPKFKSLPVDERIIKISSLNLCNNCLRSGHRSHQCRLGGCKVCQRKHNTLLHKQHSLQLGSQPAVSQQSTHQSIHSQPTSNIHTTVDVNQNQVESNLPIPKASSTTSGPPTSISMSAVSTNPALLSTALVQVTNNDKIFILRALLDCGSQSSFISETAQREIGSCKRKNYHQCVSGLGNTVVNVTEHCNINICSLHKSFKLPVKCFILPQITDKLPHATVHIQKLGIPCNIQLADPNFYEPGKIDLLLGADIFWEILGTSKISLGPQRPILQETHLGWILAGPMGGSYYNHSNSKIHCNFSKEIRNQVAKFWELEEIPPEIVHDKDNYCERLFRETTYREENGRFCVQIPLKHSTESLGDSYNIAEKRLIQLENKLKNKPKLRQDYRNFMNEYESLGHMTEVSKPLFGCYLPHHAVIKETSETTKLRVVYDASSKTSTGVSFNDIQHVGPVVQDDLFSILLRYRQHKYVISADVEKMYRQILVSPNQRPLQMILWRNEPTQPIKIFQLNTITYGTASAPFLSTRCLLQLSMECADDKISQQIRENFYIDDFLTGAETEDELLDIIHSVSNILNSAHLPLRKWRSNVPLNIQNKNDTTISKNLNLSSQSSVLGLKWDPCKDVLRFPVDIKFDENVTKRAILSNSAKLFDPLGLLGLCTIVPKIILQKLWLSKLDWDDPVDSTLRREWLNFVAHLHSISEIEIPRCVIISNPVLIELHSFSDASQTAYAATIYLRSIDSSGHILVRLLCAKTKVAPVKPTTIPRLELCGALLSARLSAKVLKALHCQVDSVYHWTDSTIVLGWLSSQASDLKPFVSHRVAEVQELTTSSSWRHVPGDQNPADLASRGVNPKYIGSAKTWWDGPVFLTKDQCDWPQGINILSIPELPETKTILKTLLINALQSTTTVNNITTQHNDTNTQNTASISNTKSTTNPCRVVNFDRYSKFTIMHRSLAYALRFIYNLRHPDKATGSLSTTELNLALHILIRQHQAECFSNEIKILKSKHDLPSNSRLLSLSPFCDDNGVLCVGGRIVNSNEPYRKKHPILLETNHNFTKLLFAHHHRKLLHCGPQLLLSDLRNNYWPLKGRILSRSTVNNCKLCRILRARAINPIMGHLPAPRVTPNLPFEVSGVDFGGPYYITDRKGRGCKISKCYICLFICFSTKALHIEVASDLTSDVFILCLRRFIARRGKPLELYCDNGTNFVGANNEFTKFLKSNSEDIIGYAANEGIRFKFSPACSPHFGGLWEAGIKSAKFHLSRILGDKHLTFEELSTLFSQIEAILNSRPLSPLSSDPNDLNPLTPAHFLIGRPLTSLPTENLLEANLNRLDRYRFLEKMKQHFWDRWRNEYLSELQQKVKWRVKQRGLREGDLVIVKETNAPPLKWRMARIHKLYPGSDGIPRVADVITAKGILRRAVHNLCILPESTSTTAPRNPKDFEGGEDVKA